MKSKIIFSIILSALILTACNSEPSLIDDIETSGTTASAQAVQVVQGETQSAENEGETNYILGGGTETTVSVTETSAETAAETLPPKIENISENIELDLHKTDISSILEDGENFSGGIQFFANNIASIGCYKYNSGEIRFFDINDLTVKASITAPDGWEFNGGYYPCIKGGEDVLCKIKLSRFDREKLKNDYAVIIVRNDFTTTFIEGEPQEIFSFPAGSHNISDHSYDLFDADSGEVIVEGFDDAETASGFGNMSLWYDYNFQIDNDRFVYRTCGIEWMPSFGYYDFTAGKSADFPDSRNFMPVGYYNGKIYAEDAAWDRMSQGELYTFDIDTLESEHFISSPVTVELNDYTEYSMPTSGKYIAANYYDRDNEIYENTKNIIFVISTDSGEVLAKCEMKTEHLDSQFEFIDDNRFAAFDDYTGEIYIFDVKM